MLSYSPSYSQSVIDTTISGRGIGITIYAGTLVPHHELLKPLRRGLISSVELSYRFNQNQNKKWNSYYSFPEVGISYMFMDLGYENVLGYSHSLYPYINFDVTKKNKPIWISLRFASGASYITNVYDSVSNKQNIAISSHLNLFIQIGAKINFKLGNCAEGNIGLSGMHFSNGSFKKPNYGLNIANVSFDVNYPIGKSKNQQKDTQPFKPIDNRWSIVMTGAIKEVRGPGGPKYGVGSLSVEYSKAVKQLLRLGTSLDYMYDGSTFVYFREDLIPFDSKLKASKLGLTLMGEMALDRLSAFANFGVYLYNHNKRIDPVYQRIGLRYRFNKFLYTQIALKTHLNVADYLEFGIMIAI
jgi:hypothetical protein